MVEKETLLEKEKQLPFASGQPLEARTPTADEVFARAREAYKIRRARNDNRRYPAKGNADTRQIGLRIVGERDE